jgi:hypothetical protein
MGSLKTGNKYVIAFYGAVMTGDTAINTSLFFYPPINWNYAAMEWS